MEANVDKDAIRVGVSSDRLAVDLVIPNDFPAQMLTEQVCLSTLRGSGVSIDERVLAAVRAFCANPVMAQGSSMTRVRVAEGQPPEHGKHGVVEWADDDDQSADEPGTEYSHYERKSYRTVEVGTKLGRVVPPTLGEDGRNVLGGVIKAKDGRPAELKYDDSILRDAEGYLIAQCDGVLVRSGSLARVCTKLDLPSYVDFSTGNVDFPGDVLIQRGVRDRFVVRATGSIEVQGLIEAATIISGGDLLARAGMAGREKGTIEVGSNVHAKYLENVIGQVRGDVKVDREMVNCELAVRGSVDVSRGRIVGGQLAAAGPVSVGSIGSAGNVATRVVLGAIPELEAYVAQIKELVDQFTERTQKLQAELDQINNNTRHLTATHRERQTEIMFELDQLDDRIKRGTSSVQTIEARIAQRRVVELTVQRELHQGAVISFAGLDYRIERDLRGPLRVTLQGKQGLVVARQDAEPVPLAVLGKA